MKVDHGPGPVDMKQPMPARCRPRSPGAKANASTAVMLIAIRVVSKHGRGERAPLLGPASRPARDARGRPGTKADASTAVMLIAIRVVSKHGRGERAPLLRVAEPQADDCTGPLPSQLVTHAADLVPRRTPQLP